MNRKSVNEFGVLGERYHVFNLSIAGRAVFKSLCCVFLFTATFTVTLANVSAEQVEAFTEPYLRVAVPASETGVIEKLFVKEGDDVSKKQLLVKLDDEVLRSSLDVARAARNATGASKSAEVELEVRRQNLNSYRDLESKGNASARELVRSELEVNQAAARLQSVLEELEVRHLEYERVKKQLMQRQIESPIDGVVIAIEKEEGEFVSPIANPESNTVHVKLRIENQGKHVPSGVACRWELDPGQPSRPSPRIKTSQRQSDHPIAR